MLDATQYALGALSGGLVGFSLGRGGGRVRKRLRKLPIDVIALKQPV